MKTLFKSLGYVAYPKLGFPAQHSEMMESAPTQIPARYQLAGQSADRPVANGYTAHNSANKSPVTEPKQRLTGYVNTDVSPKELNANQAHEAQHSIFAKLNQKHGRDFTRKLIDKTLEVLSPSERKAFGFINTGNRSEHQAPDMQNEELISHFHNFLQDPSHRKQVFKNIEAHLGAPISVEGRRKLVQQGRKAWNKMRAHAEGLDFQSVMKSEDLEKRTPPTFPKLGAGDSQQNVEYINDPKKLYSKLRTMAHAGAQEQYKEGVWSSDHEGKAKKIPVSDQTKKQWQNKAKEVADEEHNDVTSGHSSTMGSVRNQLGYALSGTLRPSEWVGGSNKENESQGTLQHENFHTQMNRIEDKHGPIARRALVDNLWQALPEHQRHLLDYLQNHWSGDYYDQKSPSHATEEKIARLFNHLNSPDSRHRFHEAQELKTHELPNGDIAEPGQYVIPGARKYYDKGSFDTELKRAHRNLLAAGEIANENWLKHGYINKGHSDVHKSEAIEHLHGFSALFNHVKEAAAFLAGKKVADEEIKSHLVDHDDHLPSAALAAHGLEVNPKNLKILNAIINMKGIKKSEEIDLSFLSPHKIEAVNPDGEVIAKEIQKAITLGNINEIELGGKHSKGSMHVEGEDGKDWILKPNAGGTSPALGVDEDPSTQAQREAAFWHIANQLGLGHAIPRTDLMLYDGQEVAAIHMLPYDWKNLDAAKVDDKNLPRTALEPYRQSGELFKWAILDYVLGNADRHGSNLMVSSKDDGLKIALIDHGTTFAGDAFNPGQDNESWIPYYLRVFSSQKWKDLSVQAKLKYCPNLPEDKEKEVFQWVLSINADHIGQIMQRYGIFAQPSLKRLQAVKLAKEPIDKFICKKWIGLI